MLKKMFGKAIANDKMPKVSPSSARSNKMFSINAAGNENRNIDKILLQTFLILSWLLKKKIFDDL